uniref:AraC family transcriptional regulator n=1 Tax=Thaumasiovibrio occultus TaxID=1891184 RepID=UPI000B35EDE3|nr:AraC family transcriptional regulator [Thaumasiovibrio occultus]
MLIQASKLIPHIEWRSADGSTACYSSHSHDEFSIGYIDGGMADYRNHQRRHRISAHTLVTINPGDVHSCNPSNAPWSFRMLYIDTQWLAAIQEDIFVTVPNDYLPFSRDLVQHPKMGACFNTFFYQLTQNDDMLKAEHDSYQFVEALFGDLTTGFSGNKAATSGANSLPYLDRAKQALLDNIDSKMSLETLSSDVGVSRYHLLRAFKQRYGMPPHAYLLDEKIKRAKTLLKRGESLADTALALGFADQAHFQRQFKHRVAVTPGQYQACFVQRRM